MTWLSNFPNFFVFLHFRWSFCYSGIGFTSFCIPFLHAGSANYQPFALHWLGTYCEAKGFILITEQQNYLQGEFNNGLFCTYKVVLSVSWFIDAVPLAFQAFPFCLICKLSPRLLISTHLDHLQHHLSSPCPSSVSPHLAKEYKQQQGFIFSFNRGPGPCIVTLGNGMQ